MILTTVSTITTTTTTTTSTPTQPGCINGWTPQNEKCYRWFPETLTWEGARDQCGSMSSVLVSIPDEETNNFLITLPDNGQKAWTGGRRVEPDSWRWLDGTEFSFMKWGGGQPDNSEGVEDSIEISPSESGIWNDISGAESRSYICQYTPSTANRRFINNISCNLGWC